MKKILFGVGVAILGLTLAGPVSAQGFPPLPPPPPLPLPALPPLPSVGIVVTGHHGNYGAPVRGRAYYRDHGVRYNGGYYYAGRNHQHWRYRVWNARANRYHYWDPNLNCYYYYNQTLNGYYPVN